MSTVILTVGPRASGKSTFCEKAVTLDPSLTLISRDKILIELCGSTILSPYSGGHHYAVEKMWEAVERHLQTQAPGTLILDTWNGTAHERWHIRTKLEQLGGTRIVAWYFITAVEKVGEWFWKKPGIAKMSEWKERKGQDLVFFSEDAPLRDYAMFHKLNGSIENESFAQVVRIDPLTTSPENVSPLAR